MTDIIIVPHRFGVKDEKDRLFVPYMLSRVSALNRQSNVFFLNPNKFSLSGLGVENVFCDDYAANDLRELSNSYVHLSTNHADFELECIKRFFYLRDFMKQRGIQTAVLIETDVLPFVSFSCLPDTSQPLLSDRRCISSSRVNIDFLNAFCDGALNLYGNQSIVGALKDWWTGYTNAGGKGGVCDMTLCEFVRDGKNGFNQIDVGDFCDSIKLEGEDCYFDNFIGYSKVGNCQSLFQLELDIFSKKMIKKLVYKNHAVFGVCEDFVERRLLSLHFQGDGKALMTLIGERVLHGVS